MTLTVRAAAKINLQLGVGAPRSDGFHTLVTVYQAVSLYDDLTISEGPWQVRTDTASYVDAAQLPPAGHNIVDRARALLERHHDRGLSGDVTVEKSIPIAGGLAGGSADAAAALLALDRYHHLRTSDDDLLRLAGELGSDVPFGLVGGTALGLGHGELVTPVEDDGSWWGFTARYGVVDDMPLDDPGLFLTLTPDPFCQGGPRAVDRSEIPAGTYDARVMVTRPAGETVVSEFGDVRIVTGLPSWPFIPVTH